MVEALGKKLWAKCALAFSLTAVISVPFDGQRRIVWICEFYSFEDSKIGSWWGKASDEPQALAEEADKYLKPGYEMTRYWTLA